MQRHMVAFDLDETLSASHTYKTLVDQIRLCQQEVTSLGYRRQRWANVAKAPHLELDRQIKAKEEKILSNKKMMKMCEEIIFRQENPVNDESDSIGGVESEIRQASRLTSSNDSFPEELIIAPELVIANCKADIVRCEEENNKLLAELKVIQDNREAAQAEIVENARLMLAKLDEASKQVSAKYTELVGNLESQWEIIKNIGVMCDKALLQDLVGMLQGDGHVVAIATFNDFTPLVGKFLTDTCGLNTDLLLMDCLNPETQFERNEFGKNHHLMRLLKLCEPGLCDELMQDKSRIILIDDDFNNIVCANKQGCSGFHFNIRAMEFLDKDISANASNSYLAFLIVKFGYETKLGAHIERLKLGPMIAYVKSQLQKSDIQKGASLNSTAKAAFNQSGLLPRVDADQSATKKEQEQYDDKSLKN